jgi:DNA helicase HerA-like ATPase
MSNFIKRFFSDLSTEENRQRLREGLSLELPQASANSLMDYMLERQYLSDVAEREHFNQQTPNDGKLLDWVKLCRLPIHPNQKEEYDLFARWQSVLASLHTWNDKLIFLLQRENGYTSIYLGVMSTMTDEALPRLETALTGCMPGIKIEPASPKEKIELISAISKHRVAGAVTGIPSFRKDTQYSVLQTLDKLAFGVKDKDNCDVNFSVIVIADPIADEQISDTIARYQQIGSDIHSEVKQNISEQEGTQQTRTNSISMGLGTLVETIACIFPPAQVVSAGATALAAGLGVSHQRSKTISFNRSESKEYLNKFAEYTEKLTDKHCERLRNGRNLGFWNVGVYVLSDLDRNVGTVLGMLRSVYSGDESYIEPIRVHRFQHNSGALNIIKSFNLIPLADPQQDADNDWHILGKPYQYLSTPLNTQELSLATALPRNDVPGLRFVKTAVRFANNPGANIGKNELVIGKIKDYGIIQNIDYKIDINALVRHSLIVGGTGCGKTCTCKTIIETALAQGKKLLVIEPAKEEYVSWAIKKKKAGANIHIYMPGVNQYEGVQLELLRLNPFQPAVFGNSQIDMLTRCEQTTALINASLPANDVLPIIMDETFYTYLEKQIGQDFMDGEMDQLPNYPKIEGAIDTAKEVLKARGYTDEVSRGIGAAVETRLTYLSRGTRGKILNVNNSTPWKDLFDSVTVVNLSHITNTKDRALIMSLLLVALQEYRISRYANDEAYRKSAQSNELMHLTVIEEAHNVLAKPGSDIQGTGNPQQVVADLFSNMLSEIRAYGEGLMIIDQVPTKLIPDVIKNTNYKICHRLASKDDCEVMASALALRDDQKDIIPTLEVGNAIISGDKDDAAAWVQINRK